MNLKEKRIFVDDLHLNYCYNSGRADRTIVFLPFGPATGGFIKKFLDILPDGVRIISPDYPGRGKSDPFTAHNFSVIARYIVKMVEALDLEKYTLLGASFGTAVATEMVRITTKKIDKIVLVAPGEFYSPLKKKIIKAVFSPAMVSENIRRFYRYAIVKTNPHYDILYHEDLKSILNEYMMTLDYNVPEDKKIYLPTTIVNFARDGIIRKGTVEKVKRVFVNHEEYSVDMEHKADMEAIRTKLLPLLADVV